MTAKLSGGRLGERARAVRAVLMDVDGVLTDGLLFHFVDSQKELVELKGIHTQDSIALAWLAEAGLKTGCISGRVSAGVDARLRMLKASFVFQGRLDKKAVLEQICREAGLRPSQILYLGDDLPDVPVLRAVGLGVAVANARPEVKAAAHWVTKASGGRGAVREAAELVLKAQGLWPAVLSRFEV